ncbi:enoyl-CoA hydratase/isomerase family protein [Epidermidibacterium keratini]|uniref:Enoyl-CoA hydratase/isomerase family protein n=2 Tax=Epidermidibacterium keratini TaxID=1891644 RepID=A0A7L4YUQ4_9ACTN|nr:enoyl-CoA hydratase/isomerase family protein [Epidermidibacterium keratini]
MTRREDSLLYLSFGDAGHANAMNLESLVAMREALDDASSDDSVRGVLLTSLSKAGFSAGMNTALFDNATPQSAYQTISTLGETIDAVKRCAVPVACSMSRYVIGGALELAAACDYRVAAAGTFFQMPEVLIGIPSVLEAANLWRVMGQTLATEMLLTGEKYDVPTVQEHRFLNAVAETAQAADELAVTFLNRTLQSSREVLAQQKRLHVQWRNLPEAQAILDSKKEFALAFAFRDAVS